MFLLGDGDGEGFGGLMVRSEACSNVARGFSNRARNALASKQWKLMVASDYLRPCLLKINLDPVAGRGN